MDVVRKSPAMQFGLIFLLVGFVGLLQGDGGSPFLWLGLAFTAGAYVQWRSQES